MVLTRDVRWVRGVCVDVKEGEIEVVANRNSGKMMAENDDVNLG